MPAFRVQRANIHRANPPEIIGVFNGELPNRADVLRIRGARYQVETVERVYGANNAEAMAEVTAILLDPYVGNC